MTFKLIAAALLSATLAVSATAAPLSIPRPAGIEGQADVVLVAKRNKRRYVYVNPKNGDILLGRVPSSRQYERPYRARQYERPYRARRYVRRADPYDMPMGGYGQNCGVQYWTPNPTSPSC